MKRSRIACLFGAVAALGWSAPSLAVDGVIEINAAAAIAGGVSPGDAPGYPVSLAAGRSYRLTSDLVVSDGDTTLIEGYIPTLINLPSSNGTITLDLNGFSVRCHVGPIHIIGASCDGDGIGIDFSEIRGAVVKNGMVRGMGADGVVLGDAGRVENVHALGNDAYLPSDNAGGIRCGEDCLVANSVASNNGRYGILTGAHSKVMDNRVSENAQAGVRVGSYSLVSGNTIYDNGYFGIVDSGYGMILQNTIGQNGSYGIDSLIGAPYTFGNNTLVGNNGGGAQHDGLGTRIATNFCQTNTICP